MRIVQEPLPISLLPPAPWSHHLLPHQNHSPIDISELVTLQVAKIRHSLGSDDEEALEWGSLVAPTLRSIACPE